MTEKWFVPSVGVPIPLSVIQTCITACQPDGWPKCLLLTHYASEPSCTEEHTPVPWSLLTTPFPSPVWIISVLLVFPSRFDSLHSSFQPSLPELRLAYCPELGRVDEVWHGKLASTTCSVLGHSWSFIHSAPAQPHSDSKHISAFFSLLCNKRRKDQISGSHLWLYIKSTWGTLKSADAQTLPRKSRIFRKSLLWI